MKAFWEKFLNKTGNWGIPLLIALGSFTFGVSEKGWDHTFINGDGKGYYAHLPAIFIYHDLKFGFIENYEKKHYQPGQLCDFRQPVEGGVVNRYYAGTALAQMPFFLITHYSCKLTGLNADGYSRPYQYTILFAGCFYLFMGLWALMAFLDNFFDRRRNAFIIICITLGTNLLFYTVYNPDFSHIYSFAFISFFVKYAHQYLQRPSRKLIIILAIILAIITLIRPVNLIIGGVIPFLASSWKELTDRIGYALKNCGTLLVAAIIFLSIASIQLIIYYIQTGHFLVYSYGDAGLNFLKPNFINFLFSYRKGMFIYTPLLFICLVGFYFLFKKSRYHFITLLLFITLVIYTLSSWNVWTYGMTYGQRPVIEYYFAFTILLGYLLTPVKNKLVSAMILSLVALTIPHNLMQMSQHRHYILHWDEMNREKYWKVFFRTDPIYYGYLWTPINPILDDSTGYNEILADKIPEIILEKNQIVPALTFRTNSVNSMQIILSAQLFPESDKLKKNQLHIMVRRKHEPETDGFDFGITMRNAEPQQWNDVRKQIVLKKRSKDEEFVITIANYGKYPVRIRNIKILQKNDEKSKVTGNLP